MTRTHDDRARARGPANRPRGGLALPDVEAERAPLLDRIQAAAPRPDRGPVALPAAPVVQAAEAPATDERESPEEPARDEPSPHLLSFAPRSPGAAGDAPPALGRPVALPFRDRMEAGFGRSLADVTAHTGPAAQAAAHALGTRAFTVDQAIAFAEPDPPELVVAHEVAHVLQQRNGPGPARARTYGGPGWDPLEVEADMAAHTVVAGGRAQIRGHADGATPQPFSATTFVGSLASAAKKAVFDEIQNATGYNPDTGVFEADVDLGKAIYYLQLVTSALTFDWLDPVQFEKATHGSNPVHIVIDFGAKTAVLTAPLIRLAGVKTAKFSCGKIILNGVTVVVSDLGETIALVVGGTLVQDVHFREYKLGYETVRELSCAEIVLPTFRVGAKDVSDSHGWLLGIQFKGASLKEVVYPGLPPVNVALSKGSFTLDGIGSSLAPASDSGKLEHKAPGVLPSDSHIDIALTGLRGAYATGADKGGQSDGGGGFDHFVARAVAADGQELCSVVISGFRGGGSTAARAAGGHIDRFELRGSPTFIRGLLAAEPVQAKAADALAVLESVGIGPDIGTNITLTDVDLGGAATGADQLKVNARADLSADVTVPDVGTLHVELKGFNATYGAKGGDDAVGANFKGFTAVLTGSPDGKTTKELARVELSDASGYVVIDGGGLSGGGGVKFKVSGDLGAITQALRTQLKKLPRPVHKVLPVLQQLGVTGTVAGTASLDAGKGSFAVDGDLEITLAATAIDARVVLTLAGFKADGAGSVADARFSSLKARLLTKGDKEAASVFVEGLRLRHVAEEKKDPDKPADEPAAAPPEPAGDELLVSKLVVTGDAGSLGALAGTLAKKAPSLPARVKKVCALVAKNVLAANASVTLTDVKATYQPDGKETVRANLTASVFLLGVGSLAVTVTGFRQRADLDGGPVRVGFDRLEVKLKTSKQAEAAFFAAEADATVLAGAKGDDFAFKAKKIEARGDPKNVAAMTEGARKNLKFLPQNVRDALLVVNEFGLNGQGTVTVDNLEVGSKAGEVRGKGDLQADFALAGVGKVSVTIKGFRGESTATTALVGFDSFVASLTGVEGAALAKLEVKPAAPAAADKPAAGAADKPAEPDVKQDGDEANRAALARALAAHVKSLPDQVVKVVLKALEGGSSASVAIEDAKLGTQNGKLVSQGRITVNAKIPGVGQVQLKLVGKEAADGTTDAADLTGFKSLDLVVLDDKSQVAASLSVRDASISADKRTFKAETFSVEGDGALLHRLVSDESLKLFPLEVAPKLAMIDKSRLQGASAIKLIVQQDAAGRVRTEAEQLSARATINFVHGGKTYVAPDMVLLFTGAKVQLDAKHDLESIGAKSLLGQGAFTYKTDTETLEGDAILSTGRIDVRLADKKPKATANQVKAFGNVTRKVAAPAPAPATPAPLTPDEKAARNAEYVAEASLLRSASIGTFTPIKPGRYGGKWAHIDVAAATKLALELWVEGHAITSARVTVDPAMKFDGVEFKGVELQPDGKRSVVKTDINWFVDWLVKLFLPAYLKYKTGDEALPLDLKSLAEVVTSRFMDPKAKDDVGKPDEPKLGDLATKGMDLGGTTGSLYAEIAPKADTTVAGVTVPAGGSISLVGSGKAGTPLRLSARAKKAALKIGDNTVEFGKLVADLEASRDFRTFTLGKFEIARLDLNGGAPPEEAAKKPAAAGADAPAVQKADDPGEPRHRDPAFVRELAARGVAAGGLSLPHADAIQRAFGRHDVASIRAHVGGDAAEASRAIGARAFATGDHVAFRTAPDLRLAAHEAAHVVQQRGGLDLPGGVGRAGDPFERHADAVADAVVAGRSAEPLLDALAPAAARPAPQVQRDDKQPWSLDPSGGAPKKPFLADVPGVTLDRSLVPDLATLAALTGRNEETAVLEWMKAHALDIKLATRMPALISRVRLEVGKTQASLVTASDARILELIHIAAASLGLLLPADELPAAPTPAEVQAAASQGLLDKINLSVTLQNGRFQVVAFGKTPELTADGTQVLVNTDGVTLTSKDTMAKTTTVLQATTDLGFKFSTNVGPLNFTAGIDPNQWQIGLSFGPDAPSLASLPAIFSNAQQALGAAARGIARGSLADPKALYDAEVSPHLPAIKTALAAAKAAAAIKPGKPSFAIQATGPGYQPYAAEGALRGVTVMATLTFTF